MKTSILIALIGIVFLSPKVQDTMSTGAKLKNGSCKINRLPLSTIDLAKFRSLKFFSKTMDDQYVTFYKDENYGGPSDSYIVGTRMECLPDPNPSVLGVFFHTCNVYNDQITSIRVPTGLKVTCFIDCSFHGTPSARVFTEDCPNVGPDWNDKISSFIIDYNQ